MRAAYEGWKKNKVEKKKNTALKKSRAKVDAMWEAYFEKEDRFPIRTRTKTTIARDNYWDNKAARPSFSDSGPSVLRGRSFSCRATLFR